jgi:predicted dehydrogenase
LGFQDGRSAHINAGWYWPGTARSLRVFGEKGMVVYDEADQRVVLHRKRLRGGPAPDPLAPVDEGEELLFAGAGEPLRLEDQHFLHCLGRGDTPLSHGRSGLEVVRVLERAQAQLDRTPAVSAQEHP